MLLPLCCLCSPTIKRQMEYCRDHPEEISKMVSVQRKVSPEQLTQQQVAMLQLSACIQHTTRPMVQPI
jgi:hypothetical protein